MPKSLNPFVKPLLIALVLLGLPVAAQYRPSFSSVREVTSIHVNKDGSSITLMEVQRKIETQQGIEMLGEQRITYNSTLENVELLEAYTLLADGTRVNVEPDKIRTQDDVDADGSNIYSDTKVKLIIFPKVEVGATVYFKSRAQQHTPDFPGHFYTENYASSFKTYAEVGRSYQERAYPKTQITPDIQAP